MRSSRSLARCVTRPATNRLVERIGVAAEDVPPDGALTGHHADAGARRARGDRAADEGHDWSAEVGELVLADRRRVVGIAAFDGPGVAAELQISQRAIDAAGVKLVLALGAVQLQLHRAEARAGLQPGDAQVGLDLSKGVETRGVGRDRLRRGADLQRALLRRNRRGQEQRDEQEEQHRHRATSLSARGAIAAGAIVTGVSPTMMAASPRSSLSSAR